MQLIIIIGYAIMGHMLFGTSDEDYESIIEAFITLFLVTIGSKSVVDIKTNDTILRGLFGTTYVIINMLLLNMLVAIYASHYFQYYAEQGKTQSKILSLFLKIIINLIGDEDEDKRKRKSTKGK